VKFIFTITIAISLQSSLAFADSRGREPLAVCREKSLIENCWIKPCSISLNFDGNGKSDIAYLVSKGKEGAKGIAIILNGKDCILAGAGTEIGNGGSNFDWLDHWGLRKTYRGNRDGLEVTKEGIGGVISFEKSKILWEQEGD
jgi:hypothetical protein